MNPNQVANDDRWVNWCCLWRCRKEARNSESIHSGNRTLPRCHFIEHNMGVGGSLPQYHLEEVCLRISNTLEHHHNTGKHLLTGCAKGKET